MHVSPLYLPPDFAAAEEKYSQNRKVSGLVDNFCAGHLHLQYIPYNSSHISRFLQLTYLGV